MLKTDFYPFPLLTTTRLVLRELEPTDDAAILDLRSNKAVNRYLDREPTKDLLAAQQFITTINNGVANGEGLYWGITSKEDLHLIGTICLYDFNVENSSVEIGYELHPSWQGKGIMHEAMSAVIQFVFDKMNAHFINATVAAANQPSIQSLLRHGFKDISPEGTHEEMHYQLRLV
ncbi:MAG: GNAT family N-acetyltransferase [Chitinophaga sp.]|uniref:GNAT family N-acetyltransferase n=1 Tax=Chitinophaga sp. TaxID=1869181 RepID=UPI0025BF9DA9|nr:GNAT family N-acetyltransferase [Chitinophaga sp.]MBV8251835.1 GNAT family N-acetyltransferase [Chitinophaga sp.]